MNKLNIENLVVSRDGKHIVNGVSLEVKSGEIHVIMGPNGSGKSTLALAVFAHPKTVVESGDIFMDGSSIKNLPTEERARLGLFLSMQNIPEIGGVSVGNFLRAALNSSAEQKMGVIDFHKKMQATLKALQIPGEFASRPLSEGFSGGEKKRLEVLQMKMISPKIAILDETDAGLDIDAMKVVASAVTDEVKRGMGALVITHYPAFLDLLQPNTISIMINGRIVASGGAEIGEEVKNNGYASFNK